MNKNLKLMIWFVALCTLNLLSCGDNTDNSVQNLVPNSLSPAVSAAVISVDQPNYTGHCPHTFRLSGLITMNSPGFVIYSWEDLDHSRFFGKSSVWVRSEDSIEVSGELTLKSTSSVEVVLNIERPITLTSAPVRVSATCE